MYLKYFFFLILNLYLSGKFIRLIAHFIVLCHRVWVSESIWMSNTWTLWKITLYSLAWSYNMLFKILIKLFTGKEFPKLLILYLFNQENVLYCLPISLSSVTDFRCLNQFGCHANTWTLWKITLYSLAWSYNMLFKILIELFREKEFPKLLILY